MLQERDRQIITLLLENEQGLSGEGLARLAGVSARTIRRDIKYVQQELVGFGCAIHSSIQAGYTLHVLDEIKFGLLKKELGKKTVNRQKVSYILEQLLLNALQDTCISQLDLSEKLFISLSSLKLCIREAEKSLERYHLKIANYKNKGMKIQGNEEQIRYAIAEHISLQYQNAIEGCYQKLFAEIDFVLIKEVVMHAVKVNRLNLADTAIENLLLHLAISLRRVKRRQLIHYDQEQFEKISETKAFQVSCYLAHELHPQLGILLDRNEICYIAQHISASKRYADVEPLTGNAASENLMGKIVSDIKAFCGIDFSEDTILLHWLGLHLDIALSRLKHQMNIRNEALDLIKTEYPLAFQLAAIAGLVIEREIKVAVNEDEIAYIAIHFGAGLSRKAAKPTMQIKKALLVCGAGVGMAVLIKAKIEEHFKDRIQIVDTIPGYQLSEEMIDSVDIVLTTVPIARLKSTKIINISHLLNADETMLLEREIFKKDRINLDLPAQFFREDFFYVHMDFDHKWEVVEFLTSQLVQAGMMSEIGKASVKEREHLFSTELGNLLAIPHPLYNDLDQTLIPILILRKPIRWNKKFVQVVLLINVAKGAYGLWDTFFPKLIKYLTKDKGLQLLIKEPSYPSFIKRLMERVCVN